MSKGKGFTFKQFHVSHHKCAMKVGTDSIILGSWLQHISAQKILDIGTGSGLLALMLAQHNAPHCEITAIDIESGAIEQAHDNVAQSPWPDNIDVIEQDVLSYSPTDEFDLIVSNPPYFAHGQVMEQSRQRARQTCGLPHDKLLAAVSKLLTSSGYFACVLPYDISLEFITLAHQHDLYLQRQLLITTKQDQGVQLTCLFFGRERCQVEVDNLLVYKTNLRYSEAYKALCRDFYLNF